ncbi:hypothetical protein MHI37_07340 [Paenibacillus sp. FSL H8-0548]|nr:hypothetical protein [Paenibacillus sp. FSL H8-0548]
MLTKHERFGTLRNRGCSEKVQEKSPAAENHLQIVIILIYLNSKHYD